MKITMKKKMAYVKLHNSEFLRGKKSDKKQELCKLKWHQRNETPKVRKSVWNSFEFNLKCSKWEHTPKRLFTSIRRTIYRLRIGMCLCVHIFSQSTVPRPGFLWDFEPMSDHPRQISSSNYRAWISHAVLYNDRSTLARSLAVGYVCVQATRRWAVHCVRKVKQHRILSLCFVKKLFSPFTSAFVGFFC